MMHTSHQQRVLREVDLHHHSSNIRRRLQEVMNGLQVKVTGKFSNDQLIGQKTAGTNMSNQQAKPGEAVTFFPASPQHWEHHAKAEPSGQMKLDQQAQTMKGRPSCHPPPPPLQAGATSPQWVPSKSSSTIGEDHSLHQHALQKWRGSSRRTATPAYGTMPKSRSLTCAILWCLRCVVSKDSVTVRSPKPKHSKT